MNRNIPQFISFLPSQISSYYPFLRWYGDSLMDAAQPWSGAYTVQVGRAILHSAVVCSALRYHSYSYLPCTCCVDLLGYKHLCSMHKACGGTHPPRAPSGRRRIPPSLPSPVSLFCFFDIASKPTILASVFSHGLFP